MSTYKKIGLIAAGTCVLILAVWFYYFWEYNLPELLPQQTWTKVQIYHGGPDEEMREWEDADLDAVLSAISATRLRRDGSPARTVDAHFLLMLYSEENPGPGPTILYAERSGNIHIAADGDTDRYQYYENGEELYQTLMGLLREVK